MISFILFIAGAVTLLPLKMGSCRNGSLFVAQTMFYCCKSYLLKWDPGVDQ